MSGAKSIQYSLSEQQQQQQDNVGSDHYPDRKNTTARLYPKRKRKPLIWKKKSTSTSTLSLPSTTGTISTPFSSPQLASTDHLPPTIIIAPEPNDPLLKFKPIKKDPMLCKRTVNGSDGSEPSQYKASREARYNLLTEEWKQIELVLTPTYITTYSFSTYFWPKRRVEHRIYLEGSKKPKKLELRLLSPLDYTFSLRYQHQATISKSSLKKSSSSRRIITMIFKAKSFLKCQEWYMKLYDMLPAENKRPIPKYCEVYLPTLDLTVHLPLTDDNRKHMTMEDVKHANLLHHFVPHDHPFNDTMNEDDYGLCWTLGDRIEWIHWTHTPAPVQPLATNNIIKEQRRMDWAVSPQIIEQTHRLELRRIEHTPNDIILSREKNFILKEPPPIEGFL
ncbi:hypothetical protein BDF20DRAFT_816776, partial [Mycotypha africana]|uniref:uncharacterized protein n=1 Tax=Mycotypha africana TaxID=64632 RepID=UPI0023002DF0